MLIFMTKTALWTKTQSLVLFGHEMIWFHFIDKVHEYKPPLTRCSLFQDQASITNMAFYESPLIRDNFYLTLCTRLTLKLKVTPLLHRIKPSMKRSLAFKFNHENSSDFVLKCEEKMFYVHTNILEHYR